MYALVSSIGKKQHMIAYSQHSSIDAIVVNPTRPAVGSIIWLHGLGADGNDFLSIVPELNLPESLPLRFIFPHAPMRPVTVNHGYVMRAWFDIYSTNIDQRIDEEGINQSVQRLQRLIEQEEAAGISSNKIILAGFSQGSVIALCTGLQYTKPLAGMIALSGLLPEAEKIIAKASTANKKTPIFIAHGTEDVVVPFRLGQATYAVLSQHGYPLTWRSYRMAHSVCPEEIDDIAQWLKGNLIKNNIGTDG